MSSTDLRQALTAMEPKTKAAKVREVMPVIEQKIAAGVRIADIVTVLKDGGVDMSEATLTNYLYRFRKKRKTAGRQAEPVGASSAEVPAQAAPLPVSMQELDRLMHPDPAGQAEEMAHYERVAKQQRRNRKP